MKKGAKDSKEMKKQALASSPKDILRLEQSHIITIKFERYTTTKPERELNSRHIQKIQRKTLEKMTFEVKEGKRSQHSSGEV